MRFSGWLGSVHSIFRRRLMGFASRKQRHLRDAQKDLRQVETLEQRRVLAFDFVAAYITDDSPFYVTNVTTDAELSQAPQQLTLRFTPGVEIDPASLGGISIVRSGGANDLFGPVGSFDDEAVAPGALLVDDFPSQNQIVIRFAESLPDDTYRITLSSTITQDPETLADVVTGLKTVNGEAFRGGDSFSFDVRLSLGQQVAAVVPQPITRDPDDLTAGLSQAREAIEVYFDRSESLNQTSAQTPGFYRLIAVDEATGADESGSEKNPTSVIYDTADHKASLTFAPGDLADGKLYRLEIGGLGIFTAPAAVAETGGQHDSFATAISLGAVSQSGFLVSGSIDPRASIEMPGDVPTLFYPTQEGTIDEPGHRDVPIDDSRHGLPENDVSPAGIIHTVAYNFRSDYGSDPQGNPLQNVITSEQKLRVREIFDLFSRYAGIRFVETAERGITIATGDTRVISDNTATSVLRGIARGGIDDGEVSDDSLAVINSTIDWGESEYGGTYFREAIRQIGQVLGLWKSFDVPSVMGESLPGENVFPSDYDILHLQQLYPQAGTEIDVYAFTLANTGQFRAETFAQRLSAGASSLDTVLSVYDASGTIISRNDDSFGRDSRVALELAAGNYYIAVSSTGNTSFNLDVTNSGLGGFSQGAYELRLDHTPAATAANTIVDTSGTPLDGDRDGKAGGTFNFHFRTAAAANTIYVDKIATDVLADVNIAADGTAEIELDNTSGITAGMLVFGEGVPEGTTVLSIDSATELTLSAAVTVSAATKLRFVKPGDGTLANPYLTIADALAAATSNTAIIRVLGNDGSELTGTSNNSGRPSLRPNVLVNELNPYQYYVGYDRQGNPLADGANLTVPAGVTLMLDAGSTFRMAAANVEVGSSSALVSRAGAALQVLGTPEKPVAFSSTLNESETAPGSQVGQAIAPRGGDWGGIVLRSDSDWQPESQTALAHDTLRPVLNSISNAIISHAGGQVVVDAELQSFAAIQIEDTRPTVAFSAVTYSAGPAVSATPNSFEESNGRVGPEFHGNRLLANSTNGVFIAIATEFGSPLDKLDVAARFASTEVTYVLQESLVIAGGAGSYYEDENGDIRARPSGRLQIDPGVVVKLQNSRIELERGASQLIAEGVGNDQVIFTSLGDNRFGSGGDFDTSGNLPNKFNEEAGWIANGTLTTGDWGGIVLNAGASASIADAYLTFGGGEVPLEGGLDDFNVIEVHQADLRLVNTRIEANASGLAETNRNHRGTNEAATIFVRGAQPIIVGNDFRNNAGAMISVNANSLNDLEQGDPGGQTGLIRRYEQYDDNRGPLLRGNLVSYDTYLGDALAGLAVRAEEITVESVWDDTDIVHVVTDEIIVNNFHTATGLRLQSDTAASLVVKLDGPDAGFTASGELLDIDDRIGGTVQVVGQPGYPVVLTSLADDSVGASVDLLGFPVTDTNLDGIASVATAGDWRSLKFLPLANDRNVAVLNETELPYTSGQDENNVVISAEALGILAPNYATGVNTWESAQEKTGDENRRQGFEVHGSIAYDDPTDVDIYTFDGYAGSEVWIDVDKTSSSLDTMVELLDASGRVLARSADSQIDIGTTTALSAIGRGITEVNGFEALVEGAAAGPTGTGSQVVGKPVRITGIATRASGFKTGVQGFAAQVDNPAAAGDTTLVLKDSTGIGVKAYLNGPGLAEDTEVVRVVNNVVTLRTPLTGVVSADQWITSDIVGIDDIETTTARFDTSPVKGVWVGSQRSQNSVTNTSGAKNEVAELAQAISVKPNTIPGTPDWPQPGAANRNWVGEQDFEEDYASLKYEYTRFGDGPGRDEGRQDIDDDGIYRLVRRTVSGQSATPRRERGIFWRGIAPDRWQEVRTQIDFRLTPTPGGSGATEEGLVFVFQEDGTDPILPRVAMSANESDTSINQIIVHLDNHNSGGADTAQKHLSLKWGNRVFQDVTLPFDPDDSNWRTIEFLFRPLNNGNLELTVSYKERAGQMTELMKHELIGYSVFSQTQFSVGAAGDSTWSQDTPAENRLGTIDVDNLKVKSLLAVGTTDNELTFGLDSDIPSVVSTVLFDNAEGMRQGESIGEQSMLSRINRVTPTPGIIDPLLEPNETLDEATAVIVAIDDTALSSGFVATGYINDNAQFQDRDVDLFYIAAPIAAKGKNLSLEIDTTGFDELTRLKDAYLRLFDADGNVLKENDNRDDKPGDSALTYEIPTDYTGRGFFIGVSGKGTESYSPQVVGNRGSSLYKGEYRLRGSIDGVFNVPAATLAGEVALAVGITVTDGQLLPVTLPTAGTFETTYLRLNDVSSIQLGAKISSADPGIPDDTRVVGIDHDLSVIQLSQPVTIQPGQEAQIGFNSDSLDMGNTSSLVAGMQANGPGVPPGTTITAVTPSTVTLSQRVNVAGNEYLRFGFAGTPLTTDVLFIDEPAASIGANVGFASDPDSVLARVVDVDEGGAVIMDVPITVGDGDLLSFSLNGTQPVSSSRIVLDNANGVEPTVLVNIVGAGPADQRVPTATTVVDASVDRRWIQLSGSVEVVTGVSLGFGFSGTNVAVSDISGVVVNSKVHGEGVPLGTFVVGIEPDDDSESEAGTLVLSASVDVADATQLVFSDQSFEILAAPEARGVAVLPGTLSGAIFVGTTAIQTFTAGRDGHLTLTPVSNPSARAITGQIDYETGELGLVFDNAPVESTSVILDYEYGNVTLGTLGFHQSAVGEPWQNGAYSLIKDAYRGGDFYSTNPRDAGMRVILPGTVGTQQKFFVRVRSQPKAGTNQPEYESNLRDAGLIESGQTSGAYELRLRTRQHDDKPGSTVRFADIRYPVIGVDVLGLPNNTSLVGTTGEAVVDDNDTFDKAQQVGNLLTSDRNTISIAGEITTESDIDWYQFTLTYEDIENLEGHNDGDKTWATIFDIDYADGFRGDLTLSVFDSSGSLIYIGRDSNVADDQPGLGQGNDFDDLSRGSVGLLDPFIGPIQLVAGSRRDQTYYVAVSSNERLPQSLNGTFLPPNAALATARLEPINSVRRIVEDFIGDTTTSAPAIIDTTNLDAHADPFMLSDLSLYVSTSSKVNIYNPFTARPVDTNFHSYPGAIGDLDMRDVDGALFQYVSIGTGGKKDKNTVVLDGSRHNEGKLVEINPLTGDIIFEQIDGIEGIDYASTNTSGGLQYPERNDSDTVDALAIKGNGVSSTYYAIQNSFNPSVSLLYRVSTDGVFAQEDRGFAGGSNRNDDVLGTYLGPIEKGGISDKTTGMQFLGDTLYAVNPDGQFYEISTSNAAPTLLRDFGDLLDIDGNGLGLDEGFQGLTAAPKNLQNGRFSGMFFAVTGAGRLVVIDPTGAEGNPGLLDNVFDTDGDGIGDSYYSEVTTAGATGLAFSLMDVNLWHGKTDDGAAVGASPDGTRTEFNNRQSMAFGAIQGKLPGGSYGFPGAKGALETNSFSLAGYTYADKPTLYFDYFLDTQVNQIDTARVFASTDGGRNWHLVATNIDSELPTNLSVSSRIGERDNQVVQKLFDGTGKWRQARIDLGEYAGESDIQFRFDFALNGETSAYEIKQRTSTTRRSVVTDEILSQTLRVPLDSVAGLKVGMIVSQEGDRVLSTPADQQSALEARITAIETESNTIILSRPAYKLSDGEVLLFTESATSSSTLHGILPTGSSGAGRGTGFKIDNIIVGFAERGEMVTDGISQTAFFDINTPENLEEYPQQKLTGQYQLEIRRGTEFAETSQQTTNSDSMLDESTRLHSQFDTNARFVPGASRTELVIRDNTLEEIDGINLREFGNGQIAVLEDEGGHAVSLQGGPENPRKTSTYSLLGWYLDLANQPDAFLAYTVEVSDAEQLRPLPSEFVFNSWKSETTSVGSNTAVARDEIIGLPAGDGIAISTDGGLNWTTVRNFTGSGPESVDLIASVGPLNETTVIGFFREGRETAGGGGFIKLSDLRITTAPPDIRTGTLGDSNNIHELEQGQFVIASNLIMSAEQFGVRVDAGRDSAGDPYGNYTTSTEAPHLGVLRNLPVLNNAGLVPGVVVSNNVISRSGVTGLEYAGEQGAATQPASAVPYGRIFNNTIAGGGQGFVDTIGVPTTRLTGTYPENSSVLRARIDTEFSEITSITLRDSGSGVGLGGEFSGIEVDAIALSGSLRTSANGINTIPVLDVFQFDNSGVRFTAGTQSGQAAADLNGTKDGKIDFTKATFGSFDRTASPVAGTVSLGVNGSIRFDLQQPLAVTGPLYVYFGEGANVGETLANGIQVTGTLRQQGVRVKNAAGPTLLNNVFANLGTAIALDDASRVDATGTQRTVISTSAFYNVGVEVDGASQTQGITLVNDPFVDAAAGNFYPAANAPIVDSSLNSLQDRNAYTVVTQPLGIAPSPIVTPTHDLFGQLRGDDPDQASAPGLGLNVFKDRGAIERIDRSVPTARLVVPLDQRSQAPLDDKNADTDIVRLEGRDARTLQQFVIQLEDIGVGIDRASVVREALTVARNGAELVEGTDYFFQYNANTDQIIIASTVAFAVGDYLVALRSDRAEGWFLDRAGNLLRPNAEVDGQQFTSFLISLDDKPTAPRQVAGVAGDGNAELSWLPANTSFNSPVEKYEVEFSDDGGDTWADVANGETLAQLVTVDLPNNLFRLFRVRAVNALGNGPWSKSFAAAPSEPRDVTVSVVAEESAEIAWTLPINGGVPIARYAIDGSTDDGQTWSRVAVAAGDTTSAIVTGLTARQASDGTGQRKPVVFRIAAETTAGLGAWSAATTVITPEGRPDAPTGVEAVFDNVAGEVTLTWTVPYDGEQPITDYVVSINGLPQTNETIEEVDATTRRTRFNGLERGQTYTFAVRAANTYGTGDPSASVSILLPTSAPPVVRDLVAVAGNEQVSLSWNPPADTGGLPIDGYVVEFATTQTGPWLPFADPDNTDQTAVVLPLTRNTSYWFRVAATNGEGTGAFALAGPVVPSGTPAVPSGTVSVLAATPPDGTVQLNWTYNPDPTGEQEVTGYDIYQREAGQSWPAAPIAANVGLTNFSVTSGLINGSTYEFLVVATNGIGDGAEGESTAVVPRVPADAPNDLVPNVGDGSVELSWIPPASDGGTPVADYRVEYSSDSGTSWTVYADGVNAATRATVDDLINGTLYRFRVAALTAEGSLQGAWSAETTDVESIGLPTAPTEVTAIPVTEGAGGTVELSWIAPSENGGRPIQGYTLQYAEFRNGAAGPWQGYEGNPIIGTSLTLAGLVNGEAYVFQVAAVTAHGTGLFSATTQPVTVQGELPGPVNLQSSSTQTAITLAWDEPADGYGAGTAVNYEVEISLGGQSMTKLTNGARWTTFSGLPSGTTFSLRVRAVLPGGIRGDWSLSHEATTGS